MKTLHELYKILFKYAEERIEEYSYGICCFIHELSENGLCSESEHRLLYDDFLSFEPDEHEGYWFETTAERREFLIKRIVDTAH